VSSTQIQKQSTVTPSWCISREQYSDPKTEYCYALLVADDISFDYFVVPDQEGNGILVVPDTGGDGALIPVPRGNGLLVYETQSGEFVELEVTYTEPE